MDSSKKTTVKLSTKIDLRGVLDGRIFLKINTIVKRGKEEPLKNLG